MSYRVVAVMSGGVAVANGEKRLGDKSLRWRFTNE